MFIWKTHHGKKTIINMNKLIEKLSFFLKKKKKWKDIEYFDPIWKERISQMVKYIPSYSIVLDLGCGEMWTEQFLPNGCTYYAVDYKKRGEKSIVCDFNNHEFPKIKVDLCFVSGCLEYIEDYNWFINEISKVAESCVISYCTLEKFPEIEKRTKRTWVNHLDKNTITNLFVDNGFKLISEDLTTSNNSIFFFKK